MGWFDVDRAGLRQLLAGKAKGWVLRELVQNCWDEPNVTCCSVSLRHLPGTHAAELIVEDDAPEGFYDLRHAWTLYASTRKRKDAEKRGRYNLGEKQVLALCREAEIITTTGHVRFREDGTRSFGRQRREAGSIVRAVLSMTQQEITEAIAMAHRFLPPPGIRTTINGELLEERITIKGIRATLQTEIANGDGVLRKTRRQTSIQIYEPLDGETAMLYEMGLPVVATGDRWHINIGQRVPLNADRDNVPRAYLQDVRAEVTNAMAEDLTEEDVSEGWVRDAARDKRITPETTRRIADLRYGENRVVADPGDPLSRERAIAAGFEVVSSRAMSKGEWDRMREAEAIPSSSELFPTTFSESTTVPEDDLTEDHLQVAELAKQVAQLTLHIEIGVRFYKQPKGHAASYGMRRMDFNLSKLGKRWFAKGNLEAQLCLIIHELGHENGGHIDESYYKTLCRIGAVLALLDPKAILQGDR